MDSLPKLTVPKVQEGIDDMGVFIQMFEVTAEVGRWPPAQWAVYLCSSLAGAGLSAVASLSAADLGDYGIVKNLLLATYQITTEAYRKREFEQAFDTANPGSWLRKHQQCFKQWLQSSDKDPELLMLLETTYRKLPKWLETQMRNLNPETFEELTEAIVRHLGNQWRPDETYTKGDHKEFPRQFPVLSLTDPDYLNQSSWKWAEEEMLTLPRLKM